MSDYWANGWYDFGTLRIMDLGGNQVIIDLNQIEVFNEKHKFFLDTNKEDLEGPEIDINNIQIKAEPTNKENPDGETLVTLTYYAKDKGSGISNAFYRFRDPLGGIHSAWQQPKDDLWSGIFPYEEEKEYRKFELKIILPKGSIPGIWGLEEIEIMDKAGNEKVYNFTEITTFIPEYK